MIRGKGKSEGLSIGRAFLIEECLPTILETTTQNTDKEIQQFEDAVKVYEEQLEGTIAMSKHYFGDTFTDYYLQHLRVLHDSVIVGGVKKQIRDNQLNAIVVLHEIKEKYAMIYRKMTDDFLKKKADYVHHITDALIKILVADNLEENPADAISKGEDIILVAHNLDLMDLRGIRLEDIQGLVIEEGNPNDVVEALTTRWNIPLVYGAHRALASIRDMDELIVDCGMGEVLINPSKEIEAIYRERIRRVAEFDEIHAMYQVQRTLTKDNQSICISCLSSNPEDVSESFRFGADGVGLYRTEHLFIGRDDGPTESEHLAVYTKAVEMSEGKPICFRTFDVSANNVLGYIHIPEQVNPLLGYRSTRIMLQHRQVLVTQIKAIMQAALYGDVRFVVPMVGNVNEILDIRLMKEDACLQLEEEGKRYNGEITFGIVIETPSAAVMTSVLAQEVDFIYVDTDDLLVLMTGADPMNEMIDVAYSMFDPGFIRLIRMVTRASHREGTPIGFYGQACSNELMVPLMLGIGMDELIVSSKILGRTRFQINTTTKTFWDQVVKKVVQAKSGEDVKHILEKHYVDQYWK